MMSVLSRLMIAGGVLAGTIMACQAPSSKPFRPLSSSVGTLGSTGERTRVETASGRTRPSFA